MGLVGGETNIAHFGQWSPIMANDLFKLGFMFRKAHMIKPPKIKEHLQRHYWRGVIDGDGHISKIGDGIRLYGSYWMCEGFRNFMIKWFGYYHKINRTHKESKIFQVSTSGIEANKVISFLYSNSTIFLDRKMVLCKK